MKRTLLLLLFSGMLILPECNPCRCPEVTDIYFDIQDMDIGHIGTGRNYIDISEPVAPVEYVGVALSFEVEYIAQRASHDLFSSTAMACSCADPGWAGSKHESFSSIVFTTVYDFNDSIRAGDTITSLFTIEWNLDTLGIPTFIQADTGKIDNPRYNFILNTIPENDSNGFAIEANVRLSTGEVYHEQSSTVFFRPQ